MAGEQKATWILDLGGNLASSAKESATSLEDLRSKLLGSVAELRNMQSAQRLLKADTSFSAGEMKAFTEKVGAQKAAVGQMQAAYLRAGGSFKKPLAPPPGTQEVEISMLARIKGALGGLPAPLAKAEAGFGRLGVFMSSGTVAAAGFVAVAAAIVVAAIAITAALAAAAASMIKFGLASADARRNELLHLEGLTKMRHMFGLTGGSATFMQEQLDAVSDSSTLGRDQIGKYAEQLHRAGFRAGNFQTALQAMSTAGSIGDDQAQRFFNMAAGANLTGRSVRKLADDIQGRFGPIVAKQLLSFDVQMRKFKDRLRMLFSSINVEPFLKGLKQVLDLFSLNTNSGRALQSLLGSLFGPLGDNAEGAGFMVRRVIQGMIMAALKLEIFIIRLQILFIKTFGRPDIFKGLDSGNLAIQIGTGLFIALGAAVGIAAGAVFSLAAGFALLIAGIALGAAIIFGPFILAAAALYGLWQVIKDVAGYLAAVDWSTLGGRIIDGLVNGIKAGFSKIKGAFSGLKEAAVNAFRQAFSIRSPSRLFAGLGVHIGAGVAQGVDNSIPQVNSAVGRMRDSAAASFDLGDVVTRTRDALAAPPAISASGTPLQAIPGQPAPGAPGGNAGGQPARGGLTLTIQALTVNAPGSGAGDIVNTIRAELVRQIEAAAIQLGVA